MQIAEHHNGSIFWQTDQQGFKVHNTSRKLPHCYTTLQLNSVYPDLVSRQLNSSAYPSISSRTGMLSGLINSKYFICLRGAIKGRGRDEGCVGIGQVHLFTIRSV